MNDELIKRIDEFGNQTGRYSGTWALLADCKAEIERLSKPVDALIAEIEGVVKCAETATDGDTGDTIYVGEAYPECDVKAILDKYRSEK